ncbi:MAG: rhodanese-like domain-containing protein [Gemmatimonadota bacterium]
MTDGKAPGSEIPEITPTELNERMTKGQPITLVDVREPHEPEIADLPAWGQKLIPLRELPDRLDELQHDEPLVLYCRSGSRSGFATRFLREQGFEKVWNLKGGMLGWKREVDPSIQEY